jgi:hypothetical protein
MSWVAFICYSRLGLRPLQPTGRSQQFGVLTFPLGPSPTASDRMRAPLLPFSRPAVSPQFSPVTVDFGDDDASSALRLRHVSPPVSIIQTLVSPNRICAMPLHVFLAFASRTKQPSPMPLPPLYSPRSSPLFRHAH